MDYYSRWSEVMGSQNMPTSLFIMGFLKKNIISKYGIPEDLVTDNGSQFVSREFEQFLVEHGTNLSKTVP